MIGQVVENHEKPWSGLSISGLRFQSRDIQNTKPEPICAVLFKKMASINTEYNVVIAILCFGAHLSYILGTDLRQIKLSNIPGMNTIHPTAKALARCTFA